MTVAAIAMQNDQARMDTISQNIANVLTPGYKKQLAVNATFLQQMNNVAASGATTSQISAPATLAAPPMMSIDATAGAFKHTGSTQDVAIEGDGFFEIATTSGPAYTRQGSFRVDVQGRLVGVHGFPVMGMGGEMVLTNAPFTIATNGDVQQDGRVVGRLKRVRFEKPSALVPGGSGLYLHGAAGAIGAAGSEPLRIGFQEGSNVSSPQEMVRLTETMRHFEALTKIVQGYDESLEKTIRKLGEF